MGQALHSGEVIMSGTFRIFFVDDDKSTDQDLVVEKLMIEARSKAQAIDIFLQKVPNERSEILHIQRMS